MNTKHTMILAAIASLSFLCGCQEKGPAIAKRNPDFRIAYNKVVIIDRNLQDPDDKKTRLAVETNEPRRTATGTLEVTVVLRNRTNFPQQVDCRTRFFGSNKNEVEDASAWQRVFLAPKSIATYKGLSMVPQAEMYLVEIQEGH